MFDAKNDMRREYGERMEVGNDIRRDSPHRCLRFRIFRRCTPVRLYLWCTGKCRFACTSGARGKFHLIRRKQFPWEIAFATFPCIGDAVMPAAWPLAYCPPDAFALPAVGTQGMANRPSPEEGTQAFLRKARWWVSEANPDEVEVWRVAEEKTGRRGSMGILRVKDQAKSKYRDTPRERLSEVEVWGCTA